MTYDKKSKLLNSQYLTKDALVAELFSSKNDKESFGIKEKNNLLGSLLVEGQKLFVVFSDTFNLVKAEFLAYNHGVFHFKTIRGVDFSIFRDDMDLSDSLLEKQLNSEHILNFFFTELEANAAVQAAYQKRIHALKNDERKLKGIQGYNPLDQFGIRMEASGMRYMRSSLMVCVIGSTLAKSVVTEVVSDSDAKYKISIKDGDKITQVIVVSDPDQAIDINRSLYLSICEELGVEPDFIHEPYPDIKAKYDENQKGLYSKFSLKLKGQDYEF